MEDIRKIKKDIDDVTNFFESLKRERDMTIEQQFNRKNATEELEKLGVLNDYVKFSGVSC